MIRTIENCSLVKRMVRKGAGEPEREGDRCLGYAGQADEPCETCKECKLNVWYDDEARFWEHEAKGC